MMTETAPIRPPVNPDCTAGKHPACRGDAWDLLTDSPAPCSCTCHSPDSSAAVAA